MAKSLRQQKMEEQLRNDIIKAALEIAESEGWEAVSTRKIADKVEATTTPIYHYFGSKEGILEKIQLEGFRKFREIVTSGAGSSADADEALLNIAMNTFEFAAGSRQLYKLMFNLDGVYCGGKPKDEIKATTKVLMDVLKKITPSDVLDNFMNYWALTHGFITIGLTQDLGTDLRSMESVYRNAVKRFTGSLRQ
ncbi:MAG: TetR/AcrR family transcriptional regulator [Ignavibacteriaceae bacterium]|nr:TetR/AcrR family transcriptional regulator [Ignavibacteriaceae bacterium]